MATASETISRWARGFVIASAGWLVVWQTAALAGAPRRSTVALGLFGFVFHTLFGKAYSLVPSYFDRTLAVPRAPAVHLPLSVAGTAGLAAAPLASRADMLPASVGAVGAGLWALGVFVFVGTLCWTVRDNLTGAETGTGEHNEGRKAVDRIANAAVPIALAYLLVGTYETVAAGGPVPTLLSGYPPQASHLLAAGTATLFVFGVGFRLLPRFLVAHPPARLVGLVVVTGALGPAVLAVGVVDPRALPLGAALETVAIGGYAVGTLRLVAVSERRRVGVLGVALGAVAGLALVALGSAFVLWPAFRTPLAIGAHYRLALLGFLGSTIVGVAFQFYPPGVLRTQFDGDRIAAAVILALAGGLAIEVGGRIAAVPDAVLVGRAVTLLGTAGYATLLTAIFVQRARG